MLTYQANQRIVKCVSVLGLTACMSVLPGCSLPGAILAGVGNAGSGALGVIEGSQSSAQLADYEQTIDAARFAIEDMELTITQDEGDDEKHAFKFEDDRNSKGGVRVIRLTDALVRVQVQVGAFGDKELGELVLARIRTALGYADPARPSVAHAPRSRRPFYTPAARNRSVETVTFDRRVLR